jgi:hypothetical protein
MLDDTLKSQLAAYLERVTQPFELVATLDDDDDTSARCANCCRPSSPCARTRSRCAPMAPTPQALVHAAARGRCQQPALCRPAAGA